MLEVDNANCVLVEFVNENNKLAVGYRIWFDDKDFIENDDNLDKVIRNEITTQILWPNCDVKSASAMKKIVKNLKDDDWTKHAVKVHSYGELYIIWLFSGWTLMHDKMSNIEKFDIAMPSKSDRKLLMQRNKSNNKENIKKLSPKNSNKIASNRNITEDREQRQNNTLKFDNMEDDIAESFLKLYEHPVNNTETILANVTKLDNTIDKIPIANQIANNRNTAAEMLNDDKEDRVETLHFEDIKEDTEESLLDISEDAVKNNTGKHKETDTNNARDFNMVLLGSSSIKIDAKILSNINKTKVGLMTCELLDALFEGQELSNSSRTGKKTNKGDGKKSIQDDARYIAIRDYVLQYFGKTIPNVDDIFKKAVTDKCKNDSRNFKQKENKEMNKEMNNKESENL
ncbi:uncharacterized protein [Temnothorax longispinosus]|uniref:uncharacterized protein n=1 Tax=Temnothorax longispinosus TaxID=300112 RepID=UPI003A99EE52